MNSLTLSMKSMFGGKRTSSFAKFQDLSELPVCETTRRRKEKIGTFRKDEGDGSEDVTPKHKFTLFVTQRNCFKAFVM